MKNKNLPNKSLSAIRSGSYLNSILSETTSESSKLSQQLLTYYKSKSDKLEKDFDNLLDTLDQIKSACDLSNELQRELSERNEEISKLQQVIGNLQIHLFRLKEHNLKLSAENDEFKIQDYENKKRIKALLMITGMCERKFLHFVTKSAQDKLMEPKLPPKLQKLKEAQQKETIKGSDIIADEIDPQVLVLNNQLLASQLEHHMKITADEIDVLLKEKEISDEERKIERQRFQKEVDLLSSKLKQSQDLLCETTGKLVKLQQVYESEKTSWVEEKNKYLQTITVLKDNEGIDLSDIVNFCVNGVANSKLRSYGSKGPVRDSLTVDKEQMNAIYREQILSLEAEVIRMKERAEICKNKFREKTEKMTAQVSYLRNKYEDLDRRRQLEAEGFRTDIRILKERLKELEKKLTKASAGLHSSEQQQQLLTNARTTLSRAKQLEKELMYMKSKIAALDCNGEREL